MNLTLYRFLYFFREAMKNVLRSPFLTTISICTIAMSLFLVGFFSYLLINAYDTLDEVGRDLRVTVYMVPEASSADVEALRAQIEKDRSDIETPVTVLTREEDRNRNTEELPAELLSGLDIESIPANPCLEIVFERNRRGRREYEEIRNWVDGLQSNSALVEDVVFPVENFRFLYSTIEILRLLGIIICSIILFAAVFFSFSTIKLAVYARRDEIEVLKLVGATDGFIRTPFFIEGTLQGLVGSIVSLIVIAFLHFEIQRAILEMGIHGSFNLLNGWIVLGVLVFGPLLGLLGGLLSVGRHLEV